MFCVVVYAVVALRSSTDTCISESCTVCVRVCRNDVETKCFGAVCQHAVVTIVEDLLQLNPALAALSVRQKCRPTKSCAISLERLHYRQHVLRLCTYCC